MKTTLLKEIFANDKNACRIDEVSDELIYLGFALPNCTGDDDDKWLIKVMVKTGNVSSFGYPNGDASYKYTWNDRATYDYKINPNFSDTL